jgi:hypothetical protein
VHFVQKYSGALPKEVGNVRLLQDGYGLRDEEVEDEVEEEGRRIVDRFVRQHPARCAEPDLLRGVPLKRRAARSC